MSFFLKINYKKTFCINGCELFNDLSNYSYWEDKYATSDEKYIVKYLNKYNLTANKKIIHIGVGNSYVAQYLNKYLLLDGLTLSKKELDQANELNIKNYNVFFQNKYSKDNFLINKDMLYDLIIDVNLKSFSCCEIAFNSLFQLYYKMLNSNGLIITGREGMNWSRQIKPVLSFSFKKFFYKRLKEFDGPKSNMLSINECINLANKHDLILDKSDKKLIIFKKN